MTASRIEELKGMADVVHEVASQEYREKFQASLGDEPMQHLRFHGYYAFRDKEANQSVLLVAKRPFDL